MLAGNVQVAANGGADLLYWTGSAAQRAAAVVRMREVVRGVPGVLSTHEQTNRWQRLGPEAGEVVVYCKAGWRFSDPNPVTQNPIPVNHGHPATRAIPFFLSGGHPLVPRAKSSSQHAHTVDVAPTVASYFGLPVPRKRYDGHDRLASTRH